MKRIFMLISLALMLVAAMALSGVAQAASPKAKCKAEAQSLTGLTLDGYNFIVGNNHKNDNFTGKATAGNDVFCGFGGVDVIYTLDQGDIFIGGAGSDWVDLANNGTFYGGVGDDMVRITNNGTFYGGDGNDYVGDNYGTFDGGAGDDTISGCYGCTLVDVP